MAEAELVVRRDRDALAATVAERLGWGGGTATKIAAALVVSALIIAAAVLGCLAWRHAALVTGAGQGIGRAIFADLARRALAAGCDRLEWGVKDDNMAAIAFYERLMA